MTAPATHTALTPPGALAAIGAIQIDAPTPAEAESVIARLALAPLPVGALALRDLGAIDTALAARPSQTTIILTPHASPLIMRALAQWLEAHGIGARRVGGAASVSPGRAEPVAYPEAASPFEQALLETLSTAASPLAIDTLLRQPERWQARDAHPDGAHDAILSRLLTPPLVVAVGHANVGKSSLVNALARRTVSITADTPGTTRDHVGVTLDLAGLVVRWVDTPGFPRGGTPAPSSQANHLDAAAIAGALDTIAAADLIVSCADPRTPFLSQDALPAPAETHRIRCATRADLGPTPNADATTAAAPPGAAPEGLETLAITIRDALVPPDTLASPIPWRFHPSLT